MSRDNMKLFQTVRIRFRAWRSNLLDSTNLRAWLISKQPMKINKVVIIINQTKGHAKQTAVALKAVLDREQVQQKWVETFPPQRDLFRKLSDLKGLKVD